MKIEHDFKMRVDNDLYVSVFNLSETEERKANKCFKIIYGLKKYMELRKLIKEKGDLMGIFDIDPTDELMIYALLITQAQNQRKDK